MEEVKTILPCVKVKQNSIDNITATTSCDRKQNLSLIFEISNIFVQSAKIRHVLTKIRRRKYTILKYAPPTTPQLVQRIPMLGKT